MNKYVIISLILISSQSPAASSYNTGKTKPVQENQRLGYKHHKTTYKQKTTISDPFSSAANPRLSPQIPQIKPIVIYTYPPTPTNTFHNYFEQVTLTNGEELSKFRPQRIENEQLITFCSTGVLRINLDKLPDNVRTNIGLLSYQQIKDLQKQQDEKAEEQRLEILKQEELKENERILNEQKYIEQAELRKKEYEAEITISKEKNAILQKKQELERKKLEQEKLEQEEILKRTELIAQQKEEIIRKEQEHNEAIKAMLLGISTILFMFLAVVFGVVIYVLPSIIAYKRKHQNALAITALNILFGWSFLGWAAAMIWALTKIDKIDKIDKI